MTTSAEWNAKKRKEFITAAQSGEFDIIIIGGGVTGAGVAREAALRGLSFCMLDKNDFAFGTSSRSSKLAHGGMRYLSSAEFGLVRESTTERNWLAQHLPNLVRPLGFMFCSYEKGKDRPFMIKTGLRLYDLLSNWFSSFKNYRKRRFLKPEFVEEFEPAVAQFDPEIGRMTMAGFYYDTNVDDARLTVETIKESLEYSQGNSIALNYAKVEEFIYTPDQRVKGVKVKDVLGKTGFEVTGKAVVACGGIWTDEITEKGGSPARKIYPTKGVHVIVPNERLGNRNAYGIRSFDDGRFFFVLRRGKVSVIGTTDTDYFSESKNLDEPWCTKEDCDYLFNTVNRLFPHARLTYKDIIGTYAGIRPLIKEENAKSESAVSRKHEIFELGNGLVCMAGGKLTTYRLMAEELIYYLVEKGHLSEFSNPEYQKKGFSKVPFKVGITRDDFDRELKDKGLETAGSPDQFEYLHQQYGRQAFTILEAMKAKPKSGASFLEGYPHCEAEITFLLEHEMAPHLIDILCRRTEAQWMIWHYKQKELAEKVAAVMAKYYKWTPAVKNREIKEYLGYIKKTIWF